MVARGEVNSVRHSTPDPPGCRRTCSSAPNSRAASARARIVAAAGRWAAGEEVLVTELSGGPLQRGTVVRVRESDLAVKFQRDDATTRGGALYEPLRPRASHRQVEGL